MTSKLVRLPPQRSELASMRLVRYYLAHGRPLTVGDILGDALKHNPCVNVISVNPFCLSHRNTSTVHPELWVAPCQMSRC